MGSGQSCCQLTIYDTWGQSKAARAGWELWKQASHGPAPSPLRSSKAFLLSAHGSTCKMVATHRPQTRSHRVPGCHCPPLLHWPAVPVYLCLRLARAKQPAEEGRKGQREAGHTRHAQMTGAHLGLSCSPPCSLASRSLSASGSPPPMHPRQLTGTIRTETRSDFNSVLRDLGPDPEGDLLLHLLPLLPHPAPEQGFLSNRCWPRYPLPRESSAAPALSRTHAWDS